MKKPKIVSEKTAPKPQIKKTVVTETKPATATKPAIQKPAIQKEPAKKTKAKTTKAASKAASVASDVTMPERVGLTAGEIWRYLDQNGPTSVAILIKELSEEEKIIQRSIGWLAQEGKLRFEVAGRIETVILK